MNDREAAVHFYEMLTGVFDDEQSKIVRYLCFGVLLLGMAWAGFNYFRANTLADTRTPIDPDLFQETQLPGNEATLQRITNLAQAVDIVRNGGDAIATALDSLHNMPFNLNPEGNELDPFGAVNTPSGTSSTGTASTPQGNTIKAGPLKIKMVMIGEDDNRVAVVDTGNGENTILKEGEMLPDDSGFVASITPKVVTIVVNEQEISGDVPEIPKYDRIKKSR